jgi:hypothetical protein
MPKSSWHGPTWLHSLQTPRRYAHAESAKRQTRQIPRAAHRPTVLTDVLRIRIPPNRNNRAAKASLIYTKHATGMFISLGRKQPLPLVLG